MDAYATVKVLVQRFGRREFSLVVNQANPSNPAHTGNVVTSHLQRVAERFLRAGGAMPYCLARRIHCAPTGTSPGVSLGSFGWSAAKPPIVSLSSPRGMLC